MSHPNAVLAPRGRLLLAKCIVGDGWPLRRAAERFQVSVTTASRWASRYRRDGADGMQDRSGRPTRFPRRTPIQRKPRIIAMRINRRWGPARIRYLLGIHPSTVHRVLSRYGLARLTWLAGATGRVIRRYEHDAPGQLVHVDIKKLGRIPDGGGHSVMGRATGNRHKTGTATNRRPGYAFLHNAVDDHSRLAYRQWFVLSLPCFPRCSGTAGHAQAHQALPAPNQWQGRTIQPHHARRMGLRPPLSRTSRSVSRLVASLQSSPRTHLTQRSSTRQPRHQPNRSIQLGVKPPSPPEDFHLHASAHAERTYILTWAQLGPCQLRRVGLASG